jgi:hypothetical protein
MDTNSDADDEAPRFEWIHEHDFISEAEWAEQRLLIEDVFGRVNRPNDDVVVLTATLRGDGASSVDISYRGVESEADRRDLRLILKDSLERALSNESPFPWTSD